MIMMFFWPFLLVGLVVLLIWAVRGGGPVPMMGCGMMAHDAAGHTAAPKGAVDVLKERYARGEIDREEYTQKLSDLS